MAKKKDETPEATEPAEGQLSTMLQVLAQYTRDQSFENPRAPESLRRENPVTSTNVNFETTRQMLSDDTAEVIIKIKAEAKQGNDEVAFIAELEYGGLFAFQNVNLEEIQPMVMIECPRILFPQARQIMGNMTQNGGFPPLLIDPPDFVAMFREQLMKRAAETGQA